MTTNGRFTSVYGLDNQGIGALKAIHWNLSVPALYEEAIRHGEGRIAAHGPLVVETGQHTGRSADDKFIVSGRK